MSSCGAVQPPGRKDTTSARQASKNFRARCAQAHSPVTLCLRPSVGCGVEARCEPVCEMSLKERAEDTGEWCCT
eukprot:5890204-Pyramimonas_sp.AAC.1